jgi:hypothetical protein
VAAIELRDRDERSHVYPVRPGLSATPGRVPLSPSSSRRSWPSCLGSRYARSFMKRSRFACSASTG